VRSSVKDLALFLERDEIDPSQLKDLERYLDKLYAVIGVDVDLLKQHFIDRINDPRNREPISLSELRALFQKVFKAYSKKISAMGSGFQAVLTDLSTDLNVPFVLQFNFRDNDVDLIAKTIMRKKQFQTSGSKLIVQ